MKKRVADIIMEILCKNSITDCFAVVGGGAMHLDNALALNDNIHKYFNHHEQACAMAAEAYARISGRMAAVCVTSGPGGTNTLTGVMGAWQDSLPMLVISGQVRYEITIESSGLPLRQRGSQEFNILGSVRNMTKYAIMLKDPLAVKREFHRAIHTALTGRRGPVWIDIPMNVQSAIVEENDLYPEENDLPEAPCARSEDISKLIGALKTAKRPCILAGSGIISGNAKEAFLKFIEKVKIPVIGGAWVCDVMYMEHPLFYGLSGNIGPRCGNFILQNADVIIALGNSLSFRQTGFAQDLFAPKAKIVMVDADENEPRKPGIHVEQFIHSDLNNFFAAYLEKYENIQVDINWVKYCNELKKRFTPYEAIEGLSMDERVCSYYFWKKFEEYAKEDTIVALGNNTANTSKLQIGVQKKEQRAITNYTCGSMGYDLPAATGASIATGKPVFCVTGDGSIMMNLQELQTIRQYNLPIKVIVFSNDGYNAMRQTCKNFFNSIYIGCTRDSGVSFPEFDKVAETFGFKYYCCNNNGEVGESLEWLFNQKDIALLEIKQRLDDPVTPKVMSRLKEDGTFETPALHDMAPFLDKQELEKLMLW